MKIKTIAGIDEVGRGALAGPMVACAVILNPEHLHELAGRLTNNDVASGIWAEYSQIKDSKKISPKKRERLSLFIRENCISWGVYEVSNKEIDELGISECTQIAFAGCVEGLKVAPDHINTDAFRIKKYPQQIQTNIIGGDSLDISIAAASIVAKVYRDELMAQLGEQKPYTVYEFAKHKGYGTRLHMERIQQYGLSDMHRQSFMN